MSDSFYWRNGRKLGFSSGATAPLYEALAKLGDQHHDIDPERQQVVEWLRDRLEKGFDSGRAFRLDELPEALVAPRRMRVLLDLIQEFAHALADRDDAKLPDGPWAGSRGDDRNYRCYWMCSAVLLGELVAEVLPPEERGWKRPFELQGVDKLLFDIERLKYERAMVSRYEGNDPTRKLELLSRQIELGYQLVAMEQQDFTRRDLANLLFDRADLHWQQGTVHSAIPDYDRAILLEPENADWYEFRSLAFEELKQDDRAQQDFDRAKELEAPSQRNQKKVR
jgi:hypothetical protein